MLVIGCGFWTPALIWLRKLKMKGTVSAGFSRSRLVTSCLRTRLSWGVMTDESICIYVINRVHLVT